MVLNLNITDLAALSDGEWSHSSCFMLLDCGNLCKGLKLPCSTSLWIVAFMVLIRLFISFSYPGKHTDLFGHFPSLLMLPSASLILRKPLFAARVSQAEQRCSCESRGGWRVYWGNGITIYCTSCRLFLYQTSCMKNIYTANNNNNCCLICGVIKQQESD